MKEKIVNIFAFVNDGVIRELGALWHDREGSDADKLAFLQEKAATDSRICRRHPFPESVQMRTASGLIKGAFSGETFQWADLKTKMEILEMTIFCHYKFAPRQPLFAITQVVDGNIRIDAIQDLETGNIR